MNEMEAIQFQRILQEIFSAIDNERPEELDRAHIISRGEEHQVPRSLSFIPDFIQSQSNSKAVPACNEIAYEGDYKSKF